MGIYTNVIIGLVSLVGIFAIYRLGNWLWNKYLNFPVRVTIKEKNQNTYDEIKTRARFWEKKIKTKDGIITKSYMLIKKKGSIPMTEIPALDPKYYEKKGGKYHLKMLKVDRNTFLPMIYNDGKLVAYHDEPQYEVVYSEDEEGNIQTDEAGNPVPLMDEGGNPVIRLQKDSKGNKITKKREIELWNPKIVIDNGKIVELPNMYTSKAYDKEYFLSDRIEQAQRHYRKKSIWEQYGNIISVGIVGVIVMMLLAVGMQGYTKIAEQLTKAVQSSAGNFKSGVQSGVESAKQATGSTNPDKGIPLPFGGD